MRRSTRIRLRIVPAQHTKKELRSGEKVVVRAYRLLRESKAFVIVESSDGVRIVWHDGLKKCTVDMFEWNWYVRLGTDVEIWFLTAPVACAMGLCLLGFVPTSTSGIQLRSGSESTGSDHEHTARGHPKQLRAYLAYHVLCVKVLSHYVQLGVRVHQRIC